MVPGNPGLAICHWRTEGMLLRSPHIRCTLRFVIGVRAPDPVLLHPARLPDCEQVRGTVVAEVSVGATAAAVDYRPYFRPGSGRAG